MLDFVRDLWDTDSLSPHGICLLWRPELLWTHVVSDVLIALAYFSIPGALACFAAKRRDVAFGGVIWSFALFILACGTTHVFSIWTLWTPLYGVEALVKAVTAMASITTAIALWRLLPKAIALPSPTQLRIANDALEGRIAERDQALADLERSTAERVRIEAILRESQEREARAVLRENQEWLRTVSDTAIVGLLVIDRDHCIRFANRAYAFLFNLVSHDVSGFPLKDVMPDIYEPMLKERLDATFAGSRKSYEAVYPVGAGPAQTRHLVETYELSRSARGDAIAVVVITDVTELKRSEMALRASRDLLQSVIDGASDAIFAKDAAGRYVAVNDSGARFIGLARDSIIGKDNDAILGPEAAKPFVDQDRGVMLSGLPSTTEQTLVVDGRERHFVVTKRPWIGPDGLPAGIVGITRDMTEQHLIALEREEIARRLMRAQETERLRIARELHDQVGQDLTGLALGLKAFEGDVAAPDALARLGWLRGLTDKISSNLHRTARELRPTSLDDLGLRAAILSHVAEWTAHFGLQVDAYLDDLQAAHLGSDAELAIYRCVQESMTNILKHARATSVSLVAQRTSSQLRVIVEDNGIGFDTDRQTARRADGGLGLLGMRERLSHVGGTLSIESSPGRGTSLFISVRPTAVPA